MSNDNWRDYDNDWENTEQQLIKELEVLRESLIDAPTYEMKKIINRIKEIETMLGCDCDGYDICNSCLNKYRREKYGDNIHDVECMCNECNGYGYRGADY